MFTSSFVLDNKTLVDKNYINDLLHNYYVKLPLFDRVLEIAEKICSNAYKGNLKKVKSVHKLLLKNANFKDDYVSILKEFYKSNYFHYSLTDREINKLLDGDYINYDDCLLLAYIKGSLEGFLYEGNIKQVVIDEAQDYNRLQYIIINKIFVNAKFTILGDINQNINPYYKYKSLSDLSDLFKGDTKYLELNKTYRSSVEIINYTNRILNLKHVNAIRKSSNNPVVIRRGIDNLKERLLGDIHLLQNKYNSTALITKDFREANIIYDLIKNDIDISLIDEVSLKFKKDLIIIPAHLSKGLEFDSVIIYNDRNNSYKKDDANLLYVACTRAMHELYIYN